MPGRYERERERAERRKIITVFTVIYVAAILVIVILVALTLSYDKVYSGVLLNGESIAGMSRDEVAEMIDTRYNDALSSSKIYFREGGEGGEIKGSITLKELSLTFNTSAIVDEVYKPGHEGSVLGRLSDILRISNEKHNIPLFDSESGTPLAQYDEDIMNAKIVELAGSVSGNIKQHNIQHDVDKSVLKIIAGAPGLSVDKEKLKEKILESAGKIGDTYIDLEDVSTVQKPDEFNINEVYAKYNKTAIDAKYIKNGDKFDKVGETNGLTLNIADLVGVKQTIEDSPNKVYEVNVTVKKAETKLSDLPDVKFNDVIGSFSTSFAGSSANRRINITLGTEVINETILMPGEEFSFNDEKRVGDTTEAKGYKPGASYEDGGIVQTFGGGICQVSTTLYNAVIKAGLQVTSRSAHSMTVGYVDRGMDAAVAYGVKDLAFKNNLKVPIKIVGEVSGSKVTFKICGVNLNKDTSYTFTAKKTNEYKEGGKSYIVYQSYRTVKVGGKVTENSQPFAKSTYLVK